MPDNSSEQEPSIEEILASIRQIISDDDEEEAVEKPVADPVRHKNNDVLELTEEDLVDERPEFDPDDIDMQDVGDEEEEDDIEQEEEYFEPEPEPAPPPQKRAVPPSDILSSSTQAAALGSLSKLAKKMPVNSTRSYDGITLEDIVREMLHPMLREWMDDHLPPMVERIVQKELEKLARRALDD